MKRLLFLPLMLSTGCTSLFFQPTRTLYRHPEDLGLKYETVKFQSLDGTEITGLFLLSSKTPVQGTVVQFHGNGENMTSHFGYSFWLTAQGYHVFILDYRGYGASGGRPSVRGAIDDGVAALDYVRARPDVDPRRLVVWGQSLGGAIAMASVAKFAHKDEIKALILENTFDSYWGIAQDVLSRNAITWALQWPLSRLLISNRYSPKKYLKELPRCPILVIHGDADPVIPYKFGEKLFSELTSPKQFWRIPNGGHLEAFTTYGGIYRKKLAEFLGEAMNGPKKD